MTPSTATVTVTAPPSTVTAPPSTVTKTKKVTVTKTKTVTRVRTVTQTAEAGGGSSSTYYANCSEARAAGAAPVYRGESGYGSHLDRDDDGVGCE